MLKEQKKQTREVKTHLFYTLYNPDSYLFMESKIDERNQFCQTMVGLAALGCSFNLLLLGALCSRIFRDISINFMLSVIIVWDVVQTGLQMLKCFERNLAIKLYYQFPLILYHLDVITKKMLTGTLTVFVILRTISIVSPFAMKNFSKKYYKIFCLVPIVLILPSIYFVKTSFATLNICPVSMDFFGEFGNNMSEYKNSLVMISFDVVLFASILLASGISVIFLMITAKTRMKIKAIISLVIFQVFLITFFIPKTTHEMVKECIRFELFVEQSNKQILMNFEFDEKRGLYRATNSTMDLFKGSRCWFRVTSSQKTDFQVYSDHVKFDKKVFMDSFYAGRYLEILGNGLLGVMLIAPSSIYIEKFKTLFHSWVSSASAERLRRNS